jgi:proteasome maturation protein
MELAIVREGEWTPVALSTGGRQNVSADILEGRDLEVGWEDVYHGLGGEMGEGMDFHTEIEMRGRMNW